MKFKLNKLLVAKLGFAHFVNAKEMYNNLKNSDFARPTTTLLGMRALRHILFFALFLAASVACFANIYNLAYSGKIFMLIIAIMVGIYSAIYSLLFLPLALNLTIKQLKLNKKWIGKLCLALLILVVIAFIGLILFLKFS